MSVTFKRIPVFQRDAHDKLDVQNLMKRVIFLRMHLLGPLLLKEFYTSIYLKHCAFFYNVHNLENNYTWLEPFKHHEGVLFE